MLKGSWINSDTSLVLAWSGSTFFTGASFYINQIASSLSPLTIAGWTLTTLFTIVASISRWRLYKAEENERIAEARKQNALAEKIEIENEERQKHLLVDSCDKNNCMYKEFYDNFNPIIINHFGINSANNQNL